LIGRITLVFRNAVKGEASFISRAAVNWSLGQTLAIDGWPWKETLGLREARTAQRNAAAKKKFWALAILLRPESQ
jgi:hypothetical protein